ncbi:MAG: hypothetical protein P4N60_17750 [Verrucomicrobiae bacterium]|nr:hypothetical protein [Verrucomicrobiae bacterium]
MHNRAFRAVLIAASLFAACAVCFYWRTTRISLAELPPIENLANPDPDSFGRSYRVDPYLKTAERLQAMGQAAACDKLLQLALASDVQRWHDDAQKISVLCRMLFVKQRGGNLDGPALGLPMWINGTSIKDWPLEPIEIVDGVPFAITYQWQAYGAPTRPNQYLLYCMANCEWSDYKFTPKTEQQKKEAMAKIIVSPKWSVPLNKSEKDFFASQLR